MKLHCGYHVHSGGVLTLPIPTDPEPVEGFVPPDPGPQGDRYMVGVGEFPGNGMRGVLWDARFESLSIRPREAGGNTVTISCAASPENMEAIGDPIPGTDLFTVKNAVARELIVGSTGTGKAKWRFPIRNQVDVSRGRVTIQASGIVGGLDNDVVIGAPTRLDLLEGLGSFEAGSLAGWQTVGDLDVDVVAGGVDGSYKVRLRGKPDQTNFLQARARYKSEPRQWGRQRIGSIAYVQLPGYGPSIDDYGLMSIAVADAGNGTVYWPGKSVDAEAAIVEGEMNRGTFTRDPIEAIGYLPSAQSGYDVWVYVRLYPTDETEWTYFDGIKIIRRENTSTVEPVDTTRHIGRLWGHAQRGRGKSPKGVTVSFGEPSGVVKVGTFWHEDGISLPEAQESVCAEGSEIWDYPSGKREIRSAKRRGAKRDDVQINAWDVLAEWAVDPGAMKTAARGTSAAGSLWNGADEGAIDTRQSNGQVIDVILSGPVGMTPAQLRKWIAERLGVLRLIQVTTTLFVPWDLGQRIQVGDTVKVTMASGAAGHSDWMRCYGMTPDTDGNRFVALDFGTDEQFGGL